MKGKIMKCPCNGCLGYHEWKEQRKIENYRKFMEWLENRDNLIFIARNNSPAKVMAK